MSQSLWCDMGDHSFSAKDPNRENFVRKKRGQRVTGNSYGQPVYQEEIVSEEETDICGPCWAKQNEPFRKVSEPEVEAETQNEDYLRGYHAGILKGQVES